MTRTSRTSRTTRTIRATGALAAVAFAVLTPLAAPAQVIDRMLGDWSGEGAVAHRGEPADRFRCRIHLQGQGAGTALFSGRCATAQGQQNFVYLVVENRDGTVTAMNRSQPPDQLPPRLTGNATQQTVHFQDNAGSMFELRLDGPRLRLRIQGTDAGQPTRGEAFLTRR